MKKLFVNWGENFYYLILILTSIVLVLGGLKFAEWLSFKVLLIGHPWQQVGLFLILEFSVVGIMLYRIKNWAEYYRDVNGWY